jgi:Ca2+/Na+ antiporter
MPFREKSAWISLVCLLGTFGMFFFFLVTGQLGAHPMAPIHWFLHALILFILLQVVLQVMARAISRDRKAPPDERERLILLKSTRNAYVALVIGAATVPLSLHLPHHMYIDWPDLPWVALGGLFIAEVVRAISQIVYFRRGQ